MEDHQKNCKFKPKVDDECGKSLAGGIRRIEDTQAMIRNQQNLMVEQLMSEKVFQNFAYNFIGNNDVPLIKNTNGVYEAYFDPSLMESFDR